SSCYRTSSSSGYHESFSGNKQLPFSCFLPGNNSCTDRCGDPWKERSACWVERKCHHRKEHSGRYRDVSLSSNGARSSRGCKRECLQHQRRKERIRRNDGNKRINGSNKKLFFPFHAEGRALFVLK